MTALHLVYDNSESFKTLWNLEASIKKAIKVAPLLELVVKARDNDEVTNIVLRYDNRPEVVEKERAIRDEYSNRSKIIYEDCGGEWLRYCHCD